VRRWGLGVVALAIIVVSGGTTLGQSSRRLTTIDALRRYPGYFHLQNVLVRGEFVESGQRIVLRADEFEMRAYLKDVQSTSGAVEVRGQLLDIGRLEQSDPRALPFTEGREPERWPRPGEELILNVTGVTEAQTAASANVRALALEPWKFNGQTVTVTGNFRGRNLFGDLPDGPGKGRYDFVLRGAEGAVWVTGMRPRGRGFDLDVDRRVDTDRWVQVTGVVTWDRGLVSIGATQMASAEPVKERAVEEAAAPPPPPAALEVVFNTPTEGDIDAEPNTTVRVQFSRGIMEKTLDGRIRANYLGAPAVDAAGVPAGLAIKTSYDAANRAIEVRFAQPLERFRTVRIELLEGITAFDGGPLAPWTLTFSVGG
jgi:hypothetical protein